MATTDLTPVPTTQLKAPGEPAGIWSIERVVALGTPLFTAAAGYAFSLLGKALPGVNLSRGQFTALFVSGAVAALTASLTWLHGRQKFVNFTQGAHTVEKLIGDSVQTNFPQSIPELRQIEAALEAHEGAIIDGVARKVGAPPSATDVAKQIVTELWPQHPAAQPQTPPTIVGGQ
jgi:hypothetical protein